MAIVRELVTLLGFQIDDAEARRYDRMLGNLGKKLRSVGRTMSLFVTAPIVGLGGAFIKAAADAEETASKFKEVFKSITDDADAAAAALSKDFDLATSSAQEMLSKTGDILVGFGFTESAALDLSKTVNALAVDIASFKNVQGGAAQASNAITKALLGEREMLKGIGIAILEEDVKRKIAQLTAEGMTFATNRQAKSFATLQLVIDRSSKAIGDYSRTSGSATNQARKLRQRIIELSVTFGTTLLPVFTDVVKVLSTVVDWLNSFTPAGRKTIVIIAGIVAALGPLLIVLGSIVTILAAIPVLTITAVAAVGALAFLIGDDIRAFISGEKSVLGLLVKGAARLATSIADTLKSAARGVIDFVASLWDTWIRGSVQPWIDRVAALGGAVGAARQVGGQLISGGAGVAQFAAGGFRGPAPQSAVAGGDSNINITLNMELNGVTEGAASAIANQTTAEMTRALADARSRAATAPRISQ